MQFWVHPKCFNDYVLYWFLRVPHKSIYYRRNHWFLILGRRLFGSSNSSLTHTKKIPKLRPFQFPWEIQTRGGTNCPVFANCSVFCDVREVRSSVLGKKVMFGGVRSSVLMFGELSEHLGAVKWHFFTINLGFLKIENEKKNPFFFFSWYTT